MAPSTKRRTNHARRRHLGGHERQDERARKLAARVVAGGGAKSRPATTGCCCRSSDAAPRVTDEPRAFLGRRVLNNGSGGGTFTRCRRCNKSSFSKRPCLERLLTARNVLKEGNARKYVFFSFHKVLLHSGFSERSETVLATLFVYVVFGLVIFCCCCLKYFYSHSSQQFIIESAFSWRFFFCRHVYQGACAVEHIACFLFSFVAFFTAQETEAFTIACRFRRN